MVGALVQIITQYTLFDGYQYRETYPTKCQIEEQYFYIRHEHR